MTEAALQSWQTDHSQLHVRRQACRSTSTAVQGQIVVLLIDASTDATDLIAAWQGQPVEVSQVDTFAEGLLRVGQLCPDVVITGPAAGTLRSAEFLTTVRASDAELPIILASPAGDPDLGAAVAAGATAVIAHPYRAKELLGLISSLSNDTVHVELRPSPIELGRLRLDGTEPRIWLDDEEIHLPLMEFLLLRYLAARHNNVVSREEIVASLWPPGQDGKTSNTLTVHVKRLRAKLGDDAYHPTWIRSVRGLGYRLSVPDPPPATGSCS